MSKSLRTQAPTTLVQREPALTDKIVVYEQMLPSNFQSEEWMIDDG